MRSLVTSLWRDPLTHFLVAAALLFAVRASPVSKRGTDHVIPTPAGLRDDLARELEARSGRTPTRREIDDALKRWKAEQVMYREALRLRLDDNDTTIRKHLIAKAREVYRDRGGALQPSEQELQEWLNTHRTSYLTPKRYDLEYVPVTGPAADERAARAEALRARLTAGEPAKTHRIERQTFKELARRFTPKLATELVRSPDWQVIDSASGWQVARITGRHGGTLPPMSELRPQLTRDWQRANRGQLIDRALERTASEDYVFVDPEGQLPAG